MTCHPKFSDSGSCWMKQAHSLDYLNTKEKAYVGIIYILNFCQGCVQDSQFFLKLLCCLLFFFFLVCSAFGFSSFMEVAKLSSLSSGLFLCPCGRLNCTWQLLKASFQLFMKCGKVPRFTITFRCKLAGKPNQFGHFTTCEIFRISLQHIIRTGLYGSGFRWT